MAEPKGALTKPLSWRWVAAYAGLWIVLSIGAEQQGTADVAAALAWSIAIAATYIAFREKGNLFDG